MDALKCRGVSITRGLGRLASGFGPRTVRVFVVLEFLSAVTCIVLLCKNIELLVKRAGDITDENRFDTNLSFSDRSCCVRTLLSFKSSKKKAYSFKHNQYTTVWMLNFGDIKILSLLEVSAPCF